MSTDSLNTMEETKKIAVAMKKSAQKLLFVIIIPLKCLFSAE